MFVARAGGERRSLAECWRGSEALLVELITDLLDWAHGLLPVRARRRVDTGDLVQETVVEALGTLDDAAARPPGVLRAYLKKAIRHRICNEIHRSEKVEVGEDDGCFSTRPAPGLSPLESAIQRENDQRFRQVLLGLPEDERMLVVGRIDLELTYRTLALATGRSMPGAAKMATRRALLKLAKRLGSDSRHSEN